MFDRNDCEPCNDSAEQDTDSPWLSMLPFLDVAALKREERRGMAKKAKPSQAKPKQSKARANWALPLAWGADCCEAELASND